MALNNRAFWRNATRFNRLFVKPHNVKSDTADYGAYTGLQVSVLQLPPGQTANAYEIWDYLGNVLFAVDASGNIIKGGVTSVLNLKKQITLSAAQITTLHSVPVSLIAAPGAGKAVNLESLVFQFKYGTVQFTGGGAVNPVYHSGSTNLLSGQIAQATIQAAANATISAGARAAALALTTNTGVDLLAAGADFAAGDSTAILTVEYDVITLG